MQLINLDFATILILFFAFALGGIVKGATGAGSPIIAIPVLTIFFDAKLAVAVMAVPNLFSNIYQIKQCLSHFGLHHLPYNQMLHPQNFHYYF